MSGFIKDFLWSSATSAYQIEGASTEDGKGLSVQDVKIPFEGTPDFKICSDHYHKYKEDVKLLSELGLKAYRFSIAWTRIYPNGVGEVNKKGLEFYENLIKELLKYNIEPIVTMYHFDLPYELEKKGGWSNEETVDAFVNYAKTLYEYYGKYVKWWLTINEQNMMILHSDMIDGLGDSKNIFQKNHNMLIAQAKAMKLCHEMLKDAKIGPAPNIVLVYPKTCDPYDNKASQTLNALRNWLFLDAAVYGRYNTVALNYIKSNGYNLEIKDEDLKVLKEGKPDFIAFNYYNTITVSYENKGNNKDGIDCKLETSGFFSQEVNEYLKFTDFGWQVDPLGFELTTKEIYNRYGLPLMVTENGLGAYDKLEDDNTIHDQYRIDYLRDHIKALKNAANEGVEVFSYSTWSAIDLISTHQGFEKRYGFIYVNRNNEDIKDLRRIKKDSFYWYKNLIESNAENI